MNDPRRVRQTRHRSPGLALTLELLGDLPVAVACLAGPDLVFQYANSEFQRMAGERRLTGQVLEEALPVLPPDWAAALAQVAATRQPLDKRGLELRPAERAGQPGQRFIDMVCQPVGEKNGQAGVLLLASDVTSHVRDRRAIQALAEQLTASEERHRTLFETLPQGIIRYGADGSVTDVNPAACAILGLTPEEMTDWQSMVRRSVHEDGSPYRPSDLPSMTALRTGRTVRDVVAGVPDRRTGEVRWLRVTAVPDALDERGRPQRVYSVFTDITEQYRAEAALREGSRLFGRLRDTNVLGVVEASEQGIFEANDAFLDIIGYHRADVEKQRLSYRVITAPGWAAADQRAFEQLRATGAFRPYDKEYIHRDGHRVPVMVGGAATGRDPLRWITFVVDLSARKRAEEERARLRLQERAARVEAESASERLAFLLRASALVTATRDRHELLERAAQLVVPGLADYCIVFMPRDGRLVATAAAHRDPEGATVLADLRTHPIPASGPMTVQSAYRSGASQLGRRVSVKLPHWSALPKDVSDILERLHGDTVLAAPLMAGENPLGVLAFVRKVDRAAFAEADVAVAEEFTRRLADAIVNVDTFVRDHTIAKTLQHAVLPEELPSIPGLDLAVRYLPATESVQVGGDWYDVFQVGEGKTGLVVGDVAGHSMASASVMGQIRSVLRAYALDDPAPAEVMRRTNAALAALLPDAVATACYAVLDQASGELTFANAGHPPPLLLEAGGERAEYLESPAGTMLGACADSGYTAGRRTLQPGATLLLYTDGLVENARRDISEGLRALEAAARQSLGGPAERLCAEAQEALLGSSARADDVCILAVRVREPAQSTPGQPAARPGSASSPDSLSSTARS